MNSRIDSLLDRGEQLLGSITVRGVLSILILVSVLPPRLFAEIGVGDPSPLFLLVFGPELTLRAAILARRLRRERRRARLAEGVLLFLDLLAIISFLPLADPGTGSLRYLRLARLFLLLGYWGGLVRELWTLLGQRERRYQIFLVLGLGALLAFAAAIVLDHLAVAHDYDDDGAPGGESFFQILWWTFRQIQDPGNLVPRIDEPALMAVSLLLTFSGLLLFSFFIGIGTTVVGEVVERSRSRPLGLRGHSVILGLTPYTVILLRELTSIYRKNLRPFRGALLADVPSPDDLNDPALRHLRYRRGDPSRPADLDRVSLAHAKRVLVLGDDSRDPDAGVISAILSVRQRHPGVPLYVDLEHERNFPAARAAGGKETHLVGSGSMLGYYVAQNIAFPGVYHLYRHLLQSSGVEIYTYLFSDEERARLCRRDARLDLAALHHLARDEHGTTLLGVFLAEDPEATLDDDDLEVLLNPVVASRRSANGTGGIGFDDAGKLRCTALRGLIGLALRFRDLTDLARSVLADEVRTAAVPPSLAGDLPVLRPPRRDPEQILILGAGPRVPRVVMELVGLFRRLQVTVLAEADEDLVGVAHDARAMIDRTFGVEPTLLEEDEKLELGFATSDHVAVVTFLEADWTHGHRLEQEGAVTLEAADVILLLHSRHVDEDSDGRIALDCLHLANLERTGAVRFRPGVHVLALVRDPAKGDLLERRLVEMAGARSEHSEQDDEGCRFTVISRERARHRFLVQSLFVRGLSPVYLDLLSSRGQHLSRLHPTDAAGEPLDGRVDPRALADRLLDERGLLLVGFELRDEADPASDSTPEVVIDPRRLRADQSVPWSRVRALYVLGDGADLEAMEGR